MGGGGGGGGEAPLAHKRREKDEKERERWREVIDVLYFLCCSASDQKSYVIPQTSKIHLNG